MSKIWRGLISSNPINVNTKVTVTLPDLPDPGDKLRLGPCKWQSRDEVSLPTIGDECLVIFDNTNEPWVVAWWPFEDV